MDTLTKLLIVEDDRELVEVYRKVFQKEYDIYVSYDGEEGLIKAANVLPEIIVLDVDMPKLNGFEVLKAIRANIDPHALVVIVSNLGEEENIKKGMELGADDYLVKANYDPVGVLERVKQIHKEKKVHQ
ncbi:response regulator transcription factor [Patescibacteria group bacterium]